MWISKSKKCYFSRSSDAAQPWPWFSDSAPTYSCRCPCSSSGLSRRPNTNVSASTWQCCALSILNTSYPFPLASASSRSQGASPPVCLSWFPSVFLLLLTTALLFQQFGTAGCWPPAAAQVTSCACFRPRLLISPKECHQGHELLGIDFLNSFGHQDSIHCLHDLAHYASDTSSADLPSGWNAVLIHWNLTLRLSLIPYLHNSSNRPCTGPGWCELINMHHLDYSNRYSRITAGCCRTHNNLGRCRNSRLGDGPAGRIPRRRAAHCSWRLVARRCFPLGRQWRRFEAERRWPGRSFDRRRRSGLVLRRYSQKLCASTIMHSSAYRRLSECQIAIHFLYSWNQWLFYLSIPFEIFECSIPLLPFALTAPQEAPLHNRRSNHF